MKWRSIQGVALLFASVLLSSGLYGAVDIEKSFDVTPGGTLKVRAARSVVSVDVHPGSTVEVSISAPGWSDEEFNKDFSVNLQQTGNDVTVELKARRHLSSWFSWVSRDIRIDVLVPGVFNLDLETSGGGISVADLSGDVRAQTSGGSIRLGQIDGAVSAATSGGGIDLSGSSGSARLSTSGGSISVGAVVGDLEASTSGGSIDAREVQGRAKVSTSGVSIDLDGAFGAVDARTSGGSVHATLTRQPEGDCYLGTSGGNVSVAVAGDLQVNLDAAASGGTVRTDIPVSALGTAGKSELKGSINGGGPLLTLRTSGGSVHLERR